jgi:UDP-N-acetylglucosamine 2-epimerase (non-hydrolysing)
MNFQLDVIVGTRPEIIKQAPIVRVAQNRNIPFRIVHTKQHYDEELDGAIFRNFGLPEPDVELDVGSDSHGAQTGRMMAELEPVLEGPKDRVLLVQGDTNTTLAGALIGCKLPNTTVCHVEAGLRSYDFRMPEEFNRRVADHISEFLFAPTEEAAATLREESVFGTIAVTGNTVIDAVELLLAESDRSTLTVPEREFVTATFHRAENVDNDTVLKEIVDLLVNIPEKVIFPLHPRTEQNLRNTDLYGTVDSDPGIEVISPVDYKTFLNLLANSEYVVTDSGGIQEEATAPSIDTKVFVFRETTERPEAVESDHVTLLGTKAAEASAVIADASFETGGEFPYGCGDAAEKILDLTIENVGQ